MLIIAAFLKNGQVTDKVSQNLIELYHFYGYYFDAKNTLINLKYPMPFIKNETEIIQSGANLLIIDPLNEQNNPAKGAKKFWKIQEVFKQAYEFLWSVVE